MGTNQFDVMNYGKPIELLGGVAEVLQPEGHVLHSTSKRRKKMVQHIFGCVYRRTW